MTADAVVITKGSDPKVLLIERGNEPFKGCWAFPGGFMDMDETAEQCGRRPDLNCQTASRSEPTRKWTVIPEAGQCRSPISSKWKMYLR